MKLRHILIVALFASLALVFYWTVLATDRYISEAHVIIQRADLSASQEVDLGSLLGNINVNDQSDQLLLREYLLSLDMLKKLDRELGLRKHYSDSKIDLFSRMWERKDTWEEFYDYYLDRVSVELDDYSGVLIIKCQGFEPKMAHSLAAKMVGEGEVFMNNMAQQLAQKQVDFLEKQVEKLTFETMSARQKLLAFQNTNGMVSPQNAAQNVSMIVNQMEAELSTLQTKRAAMLSYLMPNSPNVNELNIQIAAIEKQLVKEKAKLTSPDKNTLNRAVEAYQRLEMDAEFAQAMYKTALVGLEKGRFEAARTLKKMSILQSPSLPEYPLQPRRIYNSIVSVLLTFVIAGVIYLLAAIIQDHKD